MELNDLRSVMTLVSFLVFIGIVAWAWAARHRAGFDAAARLPFADEEHPSADAAQGSQGAKQ